MKSEHRELVVNCSAPGSQIVQFWKSTGFMPARLFLSEHMRCQLQIIASLPNHGIDYLRPHFLLDLITVVGESDKKLDLDWSALDAAADSVIENGFHFIFETMGNPSGYFSDFADARELRLWKGMIADLARRYIDRYGEEEVRRWYFETWNEPELDWWRMIKFPDEDAFNNYYDACSEGLREADPALKFGGPGTARTLSDRIKQILAHCDTGKNYFTGEQGVRLDFISVHEKGQKITDLDVTPDSHAMLDRTRMLVDYIAERHARLSTLPIFNDECDPQVGWKHNHTWRATPYYAAFIAKTICRHKLELNDTGLCQIALLGNDNGFLGSWGKRTLLARFGADERESGLSLNQDEAVQTGHFEFVRKPALNVMALLAFLEGRELRIEGMHEPSGDLIYGLASLSDKAACLLTAASDDRIYRSSEGEITLIFRGLPFEEAALVQYRLDENYGNPFAVWESLGAPGTPSEEELKAMELHDEIEMPAATTILHPEGGEARVEFTLPVPGVQLTIVANKPPAAPPVVTGLRARRFRGITDKHNILLTWQGLEPWALATYEVLWSADRKGPFARINPRSTLYSSFLHRRAKRAESGYYKVRAIDHWGRRGGESEVLQF